MMEHDFLTACLATSDLAPRLVFADWLEEHGDPRAELLRLRCSWENRHAPGVCPWCIHDVDPVTDTRIPGRPAILLCSACEYEQQRIAALRPETDEPYLAAIRAYKGPLAEKCRVGCDRGYLPIGFHQDTECPKCQGYGVTLTTPCPECKGKGHAGYPDTAPPRHPNMHRLVDFIPLTECRMCSGAGSLPSPLADWAAWLQASFDERGKKVKKGEVYRWWETKHYWVIYSATDAPCGAREIASVIWGAYGRWIWVLYDCPQPFAQLARGEEETADAALRAASLPITQAGGLVIYPPEISPQ